MNLSRDQLYSALKDSGISSCPRIPSHWSKTKIKFLCELNPPKSEVRHLKPQTAVTFLPMEAIGDNGELDTSRERPIQEVRSGYTYLCEGDVCVAKITPCFENGKGAVVTGTKNGVAFATTEVIPFRCNEPKDARFLYYLLTSAPFRPDAEASMYGAGGQKRVADSFAGNYVVALPPASERPQIAKFLDHETSKINALIDKQQQLITLLKEKRQAVISHAVTKGLNPDAPMRDSGVEWLGEVPAHWEVSKFGYVASVVRGGSPRPAGDPSLFDGDYSPWVTVAEITKDDEINLTETATHLTKKGSVQSRVFNTGTLLFSNSGATLGVPKVLMINANANDGVVGFEGLRHHREYCYYYLSTLTEDLRERIKQGSGQPNLNTDIVKGIAVPVPPADEADAIASHIGEQREKFKQLSEKSEIGIELLQERRTALISAAVTGKIDVRNWSPDPDAIEMEVA